MPTKTRSQEDLIFERMRLIARAKALAKKEIEFAETPRFQKGSLVECKRYNILKRRLEAMRSSVATDYDKLLAAY